MNQERRKKTKIRRTTEPKKVNEDLEYFLVSVPEKYVYTPVEDREHEFEDVEEFEETPDPGTTCVKYFYPDPDDFKRFNLPCKRRPWPRGREGFNDAIDYRPGDLYDYIKNHYLDYFQKDTNDPRPSPFTYQSDNISKTSSELCNYKGFTLQPHQKFVGAHMSGMTDFGGMLLMHNLGSGKTASSIVIAESNKGTYMKDGKERRNKGRFVPKKNRHGVREGPCHITIVVPKAVKNQYFDEIRGNAESGVLTASSGACVIYSEDDDNDNPDDYVYYRQFYTGKYNKQTKEFESKSLSQLKRAEENLSILDYEYEELYEKLQREVNTEKEKRAIYEDLNTISSDRTSVNNSIKTYKANMNKNIEKVYYIITQEKFLNKITTQKEDRYVATDYVLGIDSKEARRTLEILPHPDCFHSNKAVLIIDEIQKLIRAYGNRYLRLYDTLMVNARNKITGEPTLKVILLTATPIFDNAHEASLIINLLRPRIPFPLDRDTFEEFFMDKTNSDDIKIKNKLCYQYLHSGYVSYSKGANPKGFPYRRNIVKLHELREEQMLGYISALKNDIQKDSMDDKLIKKGSKNQFADKKEDDNQKGRYQWSRQNCNIAYPPEEGSYAKRDKFSNKKGYSTEDKDYKSKGSAKGRKELGRLMDILRNKSRSEIMDTYKNYSAKFHYILKKIMESAEKEEGPIFVYCEWVWYGILGMSEVLDLMGWEFLDNNTREFSPKAIADENKAKGINRYAIWSTSALPYKDKKLTSDVAEDYTGRLRTLMNSNENKNGGVCKVIFATVYEGISLKRVSQVHITSPWWNNSRIEQAIGRGIRFCSHSDLEEERQQVDVYYHCSVLPSFKNYPAISDKVGLAISGVLSKGTPRAKQPVNFKELARLTIEQKVYITSRRKTDINTQFDLALKETAVDNELNTFGNLVRFEEVVADHLNVYENDETDNVVKITRNDKVFLNRSINQYYLYKEDSLYLLDMKKQYLDSNNNWQISVWPSLRANIIEAIDPNEKWIQHEITKIDTPDSEYSNMISYIITENIQSFNNLPKVRDMNFTELMKYSIMKKGEEKEPWKYFEDRRIRNELFSSVVSLYGLADGRGGTELLEMFDKKVLRSGPEKVSISNKILKGSAMTDLNRELYKIAIKYGNKKLEKSIENNIQKFRDLDIINKIGDQETGYIKKKMNTLFYKGDKKGIETMKYYLVDAGMDPAEVSKFRNTETEELYYILKNMEK
jgi:hypothetical protein